MGLIRQVAPRHVVNPRETPVNVFDFFDRHPVSAFIALAMVCFTLCNIKPLVTIHHHR